MSNKMRMSGLISGLDTESIISALVSTKRIKVDKAKGEQTKLSWKQETWKDLNKQLKSLMSEASNLQFSSSFAKKTTAVSNSSKASVLTSDKAVNSVQSLQINNLAKTAYLTGSEVTSDKSATALSTMSSLGFTGEGSFSVSGTDKTIKISASTTISDVLTQLQDAGLNASFDEKNQRLFISAKESGAASNFSLVADNDDGKEALAKLGLQDKSYYTSASTYTDAQVDATVSSRLAAKLDSYKTLMEKQDTLSSEISELKSKYSVADGDDIDELIKTAESDVTTAQKAVDELSRDNFSTDEEYETEKERLETALKTAQDKVTDLNSLSSKQKELETTNTSISDLEVNFEAGTIVKNADGTYSATASDALKTAVKTDYENRAKEAQKIAADTKTQYAKWIEGTDAEISLNGATFKSSTNVFEINGLTITALATTAEDEEVTLTTQSDTTGIYDMVKNFFKKYNEIINKLDALYNADSAKDYSVLTDDEKDAMSDSEVEKYETKIKDSLLRGDSTVKSITSALTETMSAGYTVNGKTMYLSSFGVNTLSYFTAADNEKHAYHIDGDADDENTAGNEDVLKSMIASDPDSVVSFFTQMSKKLYDSMSGLSTSVANYRSFGSFYNDKKMTSDYSDYTTKISELEEKANDYEDKLYEQYSKMETALAKLQSNSSAVTGLLGN